MRKLNKYIYAQQILFKEINLRKFILFVYLGVPIQFFYFSDFVIL